MLSQCPHIQLNKKAVVLGMAAECFVKGSVPVSNLHLLGLVSHLWSCLDGKSSVTPNYRQGRLLDIDGLQNRR